MPVTSITGKILATSGDAFIAHDAGTGQFEIGTAYISRRMQFIPGKGLTAIGLTSSKTGSEWLAPQNPTGYEFSLSLANGRLDATSAGLELVGYKTDRHADDSLELTMSLARETLTLHIHYLTFPASGVVAQSMVIENTGEAAVCDLTGFNQSFSLKPSEGNLRLHWVQGLAPVITDATRVANLRVRSLELADGITYDLRSTRRSSEENIGWFALEAPNGGEGLFGAVEWSGAWLLRSTRADGATTVDNLLDDICLEIPPGGVFETPRRYFGIYQGNLEDAANAWHTFVRRYLMRHKPAGFPWTHFNTWFAHYTNLDEESLRRDVDLAAELGLEAFCIDAGWYEGSPRDADFSFGLGTWRENRDKFPSGLAAFADYVHARGLKFGLWVEPERLDLRYAGPGTPVPFEWFSPRTPFDAAPPEGLPQSARLALGNAGAREWMKEWLTRVIRDYRVDWLKWDNNLWLSCDPPGETRDREYAHVQGLYEVLNYLHAEFPDLVVENSASGGHRMDFGLLRRTDVQWLADDTEPTFRVRYYMAGASYPFPPEYLNSWLVESWWEHIGEARAPAMLRTWLRSRTMSAFGLSFPLEYLDPEQRAVVAEEIAAYKGRRDILTRGCMYRLFPQTDLINLQPPEAPDGVEFYEAGARQGFIMLFCGTAPVESRAVVLKGLEPGTLYRVESDEGSVTGQWIGDVLMREGVTVSMDANHPSLILSLRAVS